MPKTSAATAAKEMTSGSNAAGSVDTLKEDARTDSQYTGSDSPNQGENKPKGDKPKGDSKPKAKVSLREKIKDLQQKNQQLIEAEKSHREKTPQIRLSDDTMEIVYTGKVAGKTAHRAVEIIKDPAVKDLQTLLKPIVAMCNAALKRQDLDEKFLKGDDKKVVTDNGNPVIEATSLTKAAYAYQALLRNEEFRRLMAAANSKAEEVINNLPVKPGMVTYATRSKSPTGETDVSYVNIIRGIVTRSSSNDGPDDEFD